MKQGIRFLSAGRAARQLGVSTKALRLYEEHGLVVPERNAAGWRCYGPDDMERITEIVALRNLGLGLAEISEVLASHSESRARLLAAHQSHLESQMRELRSKLLALGEKRSRRKPVEGEYGEVSFDLPWPWGGERIVIPALGALTYITGPLGSGKTRLAKRLSQAYRGGQFLGLDRLDEPAAHLARLEGDEDLRSRAQQMLGLLDANGATRSEALTILIVALCSGNGPLIVDMVEQDLDQTTQSVFIAYLRHREEPARPLLLMTRSSAILDIALAESGETIIYCPANHARPMIVSPNPLCPGYEAVATCLASPEVRARTAGTMAIRAADAAAFAP